MTALIEHFRLEDAVAVTNKNGSLFHLELPRLLATRRSMSQ